MLGEEAGRGFRRERRVLSGGLVVVLLALVVMELLALVVVVFLVLIRLVDWLVHQALHCTRQIDVG
jgi:uncharacterized membrane protein YqjE